VIEKLKEARKVIKPNWTDLYDLKTYRAMKKPEPEKFIHPQNTTYISLEKSFPNIKQKSLTQVIASRRSLRAYQDVPLTFEELSYVLWETARVDHMTQGRAYKTFPTAGATNSSEIYVYIHRVNDIEPGLYLYVQDQHRLALISQADDLEQRVNQALLRQLRNANMVVYFTHVLPRVEYKYAHVGPKLAALEAGHACQNLSLVAEVIDCGVCAIAAYQQVETDALLQINGEDHFTLYCATLGKK
jgi:SagB-type dehydrogenase family enzyme